MKRNIALTTAICFSQLFILNSVLFSQDWFSYSNDSEKSIRASEHPAIDSLLNNIIAQTNLDTLVHFVRILSGEDSVIVNDSTCLFLSRNALHPHNDLAADFIFQTLSRYGLETNNQQYSVTGRNVCAAQIGTDFPDQKYMICAHYDDMPTQPPAPGADDNASGTAVVLEAARILSRIPTPYTVIYALWDEEEIGLIGSAFYARQARETGEVIRGVINVDMLGWDGNDDGLFDIQTKPIANSEELALLLLKLNEDHQIGLAPIIYNPGEERSDHASFWKQGYGAVHLIEAYLGGDFNHFYHTPEDRIEKFDLDYFHAMSKLAVSAISHLALCSLPAGVDSRAAASVAGFVLKQNYPNPFNPSTAISYQLSASSQVDVSIYNLLGQKVATLVSEKQQAGHYSVVWDATGFSTGVYYCRMEVGNPSTISGQRFVQTKKLILMQ